MDFISVYIGSASGEQVTSLKRDKAVSFQIPVDNSFEAPADVYVQYILSSGGKVKSGDVLIKLRSLVYDNYKNKLEDTKEQIDNEERPIIDGRIDAQISLLSTKVESLKNSVELLNTRYNEEISNVNSGQQPKHDVLNKYIVVSLKGTSKGQSNEHQGGDGWMYTNSLGWSTNEALIQNSGFQYADDGYMNLLMEQTKLKDAELAVLEAINDKKAKLEKIQQERDKLKADEALLADSLALLIITAKEDGVFSPRARVGSFAAKGHVIGNFVSSSSQH